MLTPHGKIFLFVLLAVVLANPCSLIAAENKCIQGTITQSDIACPCKGCWPNLFSRKHPYTVTEKALAHALAACSFAQVKDLVPCVLDYYGPEWVAMEDILSYEGLGISVSDNGAVSVNVGRYGTLVAVVKDAKFASVDIERLCSTIGLKKHAPLEITPLCNRYKITLLPFKYNYPHFGRRIIRQYCLPMSQRVVALMKKDTQNKTQKASKDAAWNE